MKRLTQCRTDYDESENANQVTEDFGFCIDSRFRGDNRDNVRLQDGMDGCIDC